MHIFFPDITNKLVLDILKLRTVLLPVCTTPLNEGCNPLRGLEVAKLYKNVSETFLADNPHDFCSEGIKMIYAPIRRQNSTMVS